MRLGGPIGQVLDLLTGQTALESGLPALLGLALALVVGITIHEFSHALAADRLGDLTPRYQGRLSLSPAAHLDPMGMLVFVLAGFGWGRPVQFNPLRLRVNPRIGSGIVGFAGPLSNLIVGGLVGLGLRATLAVLGGESNVSTPVVMAINTVAYFVYFNLLLAIFNLVPLPPLDGSHILLALLPAEMAYSLERLYARLGPYSLLVLFLLLWVFAPVFGPILNAPVQALFRLFVG
ncbi:MAG: site-2 protease family protein [Rudaea sp.]